MTTCYFGTMTDEELYKKCQEYGGNARMWSRKFAALLPEVEKRRLYLKHGFYSIYEFAAKLSGMGRSTVDEVLRIYKKVEDKPLLKAEIEKQGWGKVRAVVRLLPIESEDVLVNLVRTLPKSALEQTVRDVKFPPGWELNTVTVSFVINHETDFKLRKFQRKLEKERKEPVTFGETLKILLEKAEEPVVTHKPYKSRPSVSRNIPAKIKHKLSEKCQFQNCNNPSTVHHHPDRWALTHNHKRIVPLCNEHHQIAHAGLIENEHDQPKYWRIRTKPDKTSPKFKIDQKMLEFQMCGLPAPY